LGCSTHDRHRARTTATKGDVWTIWISSASSCASRSSMRKPSCDKQSQI
jgi:hypothetical protein